MAACRSGDAMDLGDHGLGQGRDHLHHGCATVEQVCEIGAAMVGGGATRLHFAQVVARAEGFACALQNDHADGGIGGEGGEFGGKCRKHRI